MAAEVFRSRRDLGENLDENLGENLDEFLAAEILRSRQDLVENLDKILRSRSKFCRGWKKMIEEQNNLHNKLIH